MQDIKKEMAVLRIRGSQFLSEEEKKFISFCRKNGIDFAKQLIKDVSGRNKHVYHVNFEPRWLDETEKRVMSMCVDQGIGVRFFRDNDGFHHYNFSTMVCSPDYGGGSHEHMVNLSKIAEKYPVGKPRKIPVVEAKPNLPKQGLWDKMMCWISQETRTQYEEAVQKAKNLADEVAAQETKELQEAMLSDDLLILAGLKKSPETDHSSYSNHLRQTGDPLGARRKKS